MEDPGVSLLKDRLHKVQTAIHKATQDAWKQASFSQASTSTGTSIGSGKENFSYNDINNTTSTKASFHLGMDLFVASDPQVLEQGIRDKLEDLEVQLTKVLQLSEDVQQEHTAKGDMDENNEETELVLNPVTLQRKVDSYQSQIQLLRKASLVRTALDESMTFSSAALTNAEPQWKAASQAWQRAHQEWTSLHQTVQDYPTSNRVEEQVAQDIVSSLQQDLRRHKVHLIHKASSVLDAAITLKNQQMSVKSTPALEEAYHVLETLEGGPLALEETMRNMTQKLYDQVLSPLLKVHRQSTNNALTPWQVRQVQDRPMQRMIGVTASTNKGVVHRLEWQRKEDSSSSSTTTTTTTTTNAATNTSTIREEETYETQLEWPVGVWKDTLKTLQEILVFFQSKILLERPRLCEIVGGKLFGKPDALPSTLDLNALGIESTLLGDDKGLLMEELIQLLSKTCLPDSLPASTLTETLAHRKKVLLQACVPFCKEIVDRKLMPLEPPPKLVAFCQDFAQNYVQHRRSVLLNQARDNLRNHDYHNTIVVGIDQVEDPNMAIFQLHQASVSQVASNLMTLLRQTMDESVQVPSDAPSTLRPMLYKTAREMLSLFRAIIPAAHATEIASVPRTAAVLHNDCIFFAHHCLTLGLEYREQYPDEDARGKLLQQTCIFLDMVPLFREFADQAMGDMLDRQAHQLAEIVGSRITYLGQSLASHEPVHEWSEAETALAAGIYHLKHLSQSWKPPILSKDVFVQSMGHLADVVLSLFWKPITHQADTISPMARLFLLDVLRKAQEDLGPSFHQSSSEKGEASLEWNRFQALVGFLELPHLTAVQGALAEGVFRHVSGNEVTRWIQAVYSTENDPIKESLLQTLASSAY